MTTTFDETDLKLLRARPGARVDSDRQQVTRAAAVKPPATANVQLNVRVSVETKTALQRYADRCGCSLATAVERAIEHMVGDS